MWLTIRSGRGGDKTVEITGPVLIGRSEVCQVILDDPAAGRRHAHLRPGPDGTFVLQDLGSGSGTYVDGQPADGEVLLRGDETLRIGDTLIMLSRAKPGAGGAAPTPAGSAAVTPVNPAIVAPRAFEPASPSPASAPVGQRPSAFPPPPPAGPLPPYAGPTPGAGAQFPGPVLTPAPGGVIPAGGPPSKPGRRRAIIATVVAAGVVVILVVVLVVLRGSGGPKADGLKAVAASPIEVDLSWTAGGSPATSYTILRDGTRVGSVKGSATSFKDTTADPSTTYTYRVDAVDDAGKVHPSDPSVVTTPGPPPAATARVQGQWKVTMTYVKENFVGVKKGDTVSVTFAFTPTCSSGGCDLTLKPYFRGQSTMNAALQGDTYTATAADSFKATCGRVTQTDLLQFHVATAAFTKQVFLATRLEGTLVITSPATSGCNAASGRLTVVATPS